MAGYRQWRPGRFTLSAVLRVPGRIFLATFLAWAGLFPLAFEARAQSPEDGPTAQVADALRLERLTWDGAFKQRPAWSRDGRKLAFARHEGDAIRLLVVGEDGAHERRLTMDSFPEYDATWSPDGDRLAYTRVKQSGTQGDLDIYTVSAEGGEGTPLVESIGGLTQEESAAWSPDGKLLAFTSTKDGNQELYTLEIESGFVRQLTSDPGIDAHPCWSPDGTKLAFATERWGDMELATIDADGANLTRRTTSEGLDDYPAWSPDGERLAFLSNREGDMEVFLTPLEGDTAENISRHEGIDNFPAWSPDGRLTFLSDRDGGFDLYRTLEPPGDERRRVGEQVSR